MQVQPVTGGAGVRDVIGAWLVCLAVAAGCFTWLAAAGPGADDQPEMSISPGPSAAAAVAEADRGAAHRRGKC